MNLKDYLIEYAPKIEGVLDQNLNEQVRVTAKVSLKLERLVQIFADGCKGGKRLRAVLVILGYELAGKQFDPAILDPALAFEVFQTAILAHDDIIDQSPTRRGKPTIYQQLGGDHYAISQAICLGDTGFFLALQIIAQSDFPDNLKLKALISFNDSMLKTAAGQMLDIEIPHQSAVRKESEALTIFHFKTAHYTIIGPLHLGAILAGADQNLLDKMEEFGKNLGIAYQIQDDILGVFGSEEEMGKSATSDIEEGKNTLLLTYVLENGDDSQKAILEKYYGQGKIGKEELEQIRTVFKETGSLDHSNKKAEDYVNKAIAMISEITTNEEHQTLLTELSQFLIKRQK